MIVEESIHVVFDETNHAKQESLRNHVEEDEQNIILKKLETCPEKQLIDYAKQPVEILQQNELPKEWSIPRDHSVDNIIGQIQKGVSTRRTVSNVCRHMAFVSETEPKSIGEALKDENWVVAMHEELNRFTRNDIKQSKDGIFLSQMKYCNEILKRFELENCKEAITPMSTSCYMDADLAGTTVDQTKFRGLISSLLYLVASIPDIMFAVCLCARFQSNPKESHFKAAKRILKYLKGTTFVGLWYPSHSTIHLVGYSNSNFAGCKLNSKKQACVALSTAKAEYIVVVSCCAQILWIKQ
ncbi:uncharacterized mitochondrial protein AtMg00810-like [Phaseolus vulgaris]|uniref:uncharacterized mitochondrial protein AtMg00810-like n=1 Tax=Phaseolus vulgaris TaxID=3885 RepID=UPI0035CB5884